MLRFLRTASLILTMFGTACVSAPPISSTFSPSQASFAQRTGTGSIVGQAFLRQVNGGVVTAAGSDVILIPDQAYTRELAIRLQRGFSAMGEEQPLAGYQRTTVADASGTFTFTGIPGGNYIVLTSVTWGVPTQYGISQQGGVLIDNVSVTDGRVSQVILR